MRTDSCYLWKLASFNLSYSQVKQKNQAHQVSDEMSLLLLHKIASISTSLGLQQQQKKAIEIQKEELFPPDFNSKRKPKEETHKQMFHTVSDF